MSGRGGKNAFLRIANYGARSLTRSLVHSFTRSLDDDDDDPMHLMSMQFQFAVIRKRYPPLIFIQSQSWHGAECHIISRYVTVGLSRFFVCFLFDTSKSCATAQRFLVLRLGRFNLKVTPRAFTASD